MAPISKSACSSLGGKTKGQPLTKLKIDPAEVLCEGKNPAVIVFRAAISERTNSPVKAADSHSHSSKVLIDFKI